ncbi:hypothetical protein [Campylobacter concisus]|jgi:hypothetical protein|uniref:hypothetical protein n=1 Tax=Campylobacter concisus TaxID=199 RepID=UPI000CD89A17|nr:hypothetical protein [Campylobacter concisus]
MQSVTFFKRDINSKDVIARLDNITEYEYNIITEKIKDGLKEENINVIFEKGNMLDKSDISQKTKAIDKIEKMIKFRINTTLLTLSIISTSISFFFGVSENQLLYKAFISLACMFSVIPAFWIVKDIFKNALKRK